MAVELGTVRIKHIKRWWQAGYFRMDEQAAAVTTLAPVADSLHFYAKDKAAVSQLYWHDDADVEHEVADAASIITDHGALNGLADDDHPLYLLASDATNRATFAANWLDLTDSGATTLHSHVVDHGGLTGLLDDDHTQYPLSAGRSSGQTLNGRTDAIDNTIVGLVLSSTINAAKGVINLGSTIYIDESNTRMAIATGGDITANAVFHSAATLTRQFLFNRADLGGASPTSTIRGTYFSLSDSGLFTFANQETSTTSGFRFFTGNNGANSWWFTTRHNLVISGATADQPSTGTSGLIFEDGTALATMASNTAGLYADDIAGNVSMHAINENGNIIKLVKGSTFTQTYATADATLGAYTADNESAAYTGIDNAQAGTPYAQLTDLNALRTAYETLRAFTEDAVAMLNSLVDDHQTNGMAG